MGGAEDETPFIYDRFAVDGGGTSLIDTDVYDNPSFALGNVLQGDDVFFDGEQTNTGAEPGVGPIPPPLFAPPDWSPGSSYSHLDEETYPSGDLNSLMTPFIGSAEVNHNPGAITCGMFVDMGWPAGPGCEALLESPVALFEGQPEQGRARLSWVETGRSGVEEYRIERSYFDAPFEQTDVISSRGADTYSIDLEDLDAGDYAFRLSYVPTGEDDPIEVDTIEFTVPLEEERIISEIYPNPFSDRTNIELALQGDADESEPLRIEVYNALGQKVDVLFDGERRVNDPRPVEFNAGDYGYLPSGRYFFRILGDGFDKTRSAVLVH